jgi:hypothetical protein
MIYFIIALLIVVFIRIKWKPYLDIFTDNNGKRHIIIWYNSKEGRKYKDLLND